MLNHKELKRVDRAFAILRELVESNFTDCDAQQRATELIEELNAARSRLREYGPVDPVSLTVLQDLPD